MRKDILGIPLDDLSLGDIQQKVLGGERLFQVFVNIHKINLFDKDPRLQELAQDEQCLFSADGRWAAWFAKLAGLRPKQRFGGLDVIEAFFSLAQKRNFKIYLLGAQAEVITKAQDVLRVRFPQAKVVGWQHGFFSDEAALIQEIREAKPDILFLALPSPRKELLGYQLFKEVASLKYAAGVGGAFDILAGRAKRAPLVWQRLGLEWFYRCCQEPRRLFPRYLRDALGLAWIILRGFYKR